MLLEEMMEEFTYVARRNDGNQIKKEHIKEQTSTIYGLKDNTKYNVYMIARDAKGDYFKSKVKKITTLALPDVKLNDGVIKGSGSSDSEAGSNGSSSTTTQNDKATSAKTTAVIGGTQHTFTGLDQNKTYSIATRVTDFVGHQIATKAIDKKTSEVPTLVVADKDIVFTADPDQEKDVWSNTTVKVSAELAEKYSKEKALLIQ